jgi:hypothetical protein
MEQGKMDRPAKACPVFEAVEGGGSCQPYTFVKCGVCGVNLEGSCQLTVENISDMLIRREDNKEFARQKYLERHHTARAMVQTLLRNEACLVAEDELHEKQENLHEKLLVRILIIVLSSIIGAIGGMMYVFYCR